MRILEIVPYRLWVNMKNGRSASVHGSCPWLSSDEKADWEMQTQGFTWRMNNGTFGFGRVPAATREEAEEVMRKFNARY